ncbi:cytochrome P450 [Frankia sp. AgB1.9]|uniref:cytochrome P450 n=1 Tax=unclassified Frankia TaxID=2632575 RepID=UPI001932BB49|nr:MULTISPECIES: cytochrome P450 [unclassified Frankia]MBL7493558.1 cytochrome P450 [Frankia sp. AgW1.1]MBL7549819.1 cytochrome P450 [Frankia sp. AgB1.9]MBL7622425.1 cytochrome P450 [Frankia sp. AgB1.8]
MTTAHAAEPAPPASAPASPFDWNPFAQSFYNDPQPAYRRLRDEAPVYYNEKQNFYALSRHADVAEALKDTATFSSTRGIELHSIQEGQVAHAGIIQMDPPEQTRMRLLVSRAFQPRVIQGLEPEVVAVIEHYAGGLGQEFDAVADFSALFPMEIISRMVGIPAEKRDWMRHGIDYILGRDNSPAMTDDQMRVAIELSTYYYTLAVERRKNPGDDMISMLIEAEVLREDGTKTALDDIEITTFISLLGGAGAETVTKLIGNAVVLFGRHPDQWQLLQERPELIPNAIEEVLRYDPPATYTARYLAREYTGHGVTIPAGAAALLLIGAATRDERTYEDPERFDIRREPQMNLAFGFGAHRCLGAALARIEGRVALERLLRHMPRFEVDESGLRRVNMTNVLGYSNVPVRVLP